MHTFTVQEGQAELAGMVYASCSTSPVRNISLRVWRIEQSVEINYKCDGFWKRVK